MPLFVLDHAEDATSLPSGRGTACRRAKVYNDSCKQKGVPCVGGAAANVQPRHVPRVLSSHQKFATAMVVAKELASLASEVGMVEFHERLTFLTDVRRSWAEGSSVRLTSTCEYDLTHKFSWYKYSTNVSYR